jgi:hypothetical protein
VGEKKEKKRPLDGGRSLPEGAFIHFRNVLDMGGRGEVTGNVIRWRVNTSCVEHGGLTIHRCLVLGIHITAFAQDSDRNRPSLESCPRARFPLPGAMIIGDNHRPRVSRKWEEVV